MKQPRYIVAGTSDCFYLTCELYGWNPNDIFFVGILESEKFFADGNIYCADWIYPREIAEFYDLPNCIEDTRAVEEHTPIEKLEKE